MIYFHRVCAKNFLKHADVELPLSQQGLVIVQGKNGAGKSSLFEVIPWILFDHIPRGTSKRNIIRHGTSSTLAELDMVINNQDVRITKEYPSGQIKVQIDEDVYKYRTLKDGTKFVRSLLNNISAQFFYYTTFLRQYNEDNFFSIPNRDKKMLLEEVLDIQEFRDLYDYYSQLVHTNQEQLLQVESYLSKLKAMYSSLSALIKEVKEKNRFLLKEMSSYNQEEINLKLDQIVKQLETIRKRIVQLEQKKNQLQAEIQQTQENLVQRAETSPKTLSTIALKLISKALQTDVCPVCKRPLTDDIRQKFRRTLQKHQQDQTKQSGELDQLKPLWDQYSATQREYNQLASQEASLVQTKKNLEQEIKRTKERLSQYKEEYQRNKEKLSTLKEIVDMAKQLESELTNTQEEMKDYVETLSLAKNLFSNKGIKNILLPKYTASFIDKINVYLNLLLPDVRVICKESDTTKLDLVFQRNGYDYDFYQFSGGERKRIEIASIFALRELVQEIGKFYTNILILDEVFDQLDTEGINAVIEYLRQSRIDSIFVITHSELNIGTTDKVISL